MPRPMPFGLHGRRKVLEKNTMDIVLLLARIVLALVFGLAGIGKLLDLKGSRNCLIGFGFPEWLVSPVGLSLPFVELAFAALLLPLPTVWWGACGALGLLTAFVVVIGLNMARGRRPDCHCFGQLHSEPIGPWTLARNALLALLAGLVLSQARHNPGLSIFDALALVFSRHGALLPIGAVVVSAVAIQSWLIFHLFRQNGRLLLRIEALEAGPRSMPRPPAQAQSGLKVGSPAPAFELPLAMGGTSSLDRLRAAGKRVVLIFSDSNCGPCKALMPEVARWQREFSGKLTVAVVSRGVSNEKMAAKHGLENVFVQKNREVAERYHAFGTPTAVLVEANGVIASGLGSGVAQITSLVQAAANGTMPLVKSQPSPVSTPLVVGSAASTFSAPDLDGNLVTTSDFMGRKTMLLFWNPSCGFCNRMLPDLKRWEAAHGGDELRVVLISAGTTEQ